MYVLENGLSIDAQWYIDHQLSGPLLRIFDPILTNASQKLFTGDHTRKVVSAAGGAGGLVGLKTTQVLRKCLSCKVTITPNNAIPTKASSENTQQSLSLCRHCVTEK